jgi:aconitate hydratase
MGVVPLQLADGVTAKTLGLDGTETLALEDIDVSEGLPAKRTCEVVATRQDGTEVSFECVVRIDTPTEGAFVAAGGILPYVLDQLAAE